MTIAGTGTYMNKFDFHYQLHHAYAAVRVAQVVDNILPDLELLLGIAGPDVSQEYIQATHPSPFLLTISLTRITTPKSQNLSLKSLYFPSLEKRRRALK